MDPMLRNHKLLFESISKSADYIVTFDGGGYFSAKSKSGIYPNLTLCTEPEKWDLQLFNHYLDAVENGQASPYLLIDKEKIDDSVLLALKGNGFRPIEEWTAMSVDTNLATVKNSDLRCRPVSNQIQLHEWIDVVSKGLFNNSPLDIQIFECLMDMGHIELWEGIFEGKTVCTLLTTIEQQNMGFYMGTTLKEYRRKGFAECLLSHCLVESAKRGVTHCHIEATKLGLSLYQKMGFTETGKYAIYWKVGKQYI